MADKPSSKFLISSFIWTKFGIPDQFCAYNPLFGDHLFLLRAKTGQQFCCGKTLFESIECGKRKVGSWLRYWVSAGEDQRQCEFDSWQQSYSVCLNFPVVHFGNLSTAQNSWNPNTWFNFRDISHSNVFASARTLRWFGTIDWKLLVPLARPISKSCFNLLRRERPWSPIRFDQGLTISLWSCFSLHTSIDLDSHSTPRGVSWSSTLNQCFAPEVWHTELMWVFLDASRGAFGTKHGPSLNQIFGCQTSLWADATPLWIQKAGT